VTQVHKRHGAREHPRAPRGARGAPHKACPVAHQAQGLDPAHTRFFYWERLDSGLAPATVHKINAILHKSLRAAVSDGLVPHNAAAGLKLPRIAQEEIDPLDAEDGRPKATQDGPRDL
jgi:hypothetical protein